MEISLRVSQEFAYSTKPEPTRLGASKELRGSETLQGFIDRLGPEAQGFGGDPLISGVDSLVEVEARGQLHRQEAMALDAQPGEVPRVRKGRVQKWHRDPLRVGLTQDAGQGIEQAHIRLGGAGIMANDLELDVLTHKTT